MPFNTQAALAAGYSQQEINQYLQSIQMTGAIRYPAMAGSEMLSGFESLESVPAAGINYLTSKINPTLQSAGYGQFPQVPDIQNLTDRIGLTNNVALIPGMGQYPEAERIGAGAARGLGAVLPAVALGGPTALMLGAGAIGGGAGEATTDFTGSPLAGAVVGAGVGLLGGGVASLARNAVAPSAENVLSGIASDIGPEGATMYNAGQEIQNELSKSSLISSAGLGPGTALPAKDLTRILNAKPMQAGNMLLNDPDSLAILRQEMPNSVDRLAAGMINRNAPQWNRLAPEVQDQLIPDEAAQTRLEGAIKNASAAGQKGMGAGEAVGATVAGGLLGLGAHALGLVPGGESAAIEFGTAGAFAAEMLRSRIAAHAILDPWVRNSMMTGAIGGSAGSQTPIQPGLLPNQ